MDSPRAVIIPRTKDRSRSRNLKILYCVPNFYFSSSCVTLGLKPVGVCPIFKVNSAQEACTKCFAVRILEFEIFQITNANETKTENS